MDFLAMKDQRVAEVSFPAVPGLPPAEGPRPESARGNGALASPG